VNTFGKIIKAHLGCEIGISTMEIQVKVFWKRLRRQVGDCDNCTIAIGRADSIAPSPRQEEGEQMSK
jgi:hypothetical protein